MERLRVHAATLALVCITVVWGATFALIKRSLDSMPPFWFMAWRFGVAFAITGPVALLRGSRLRRQEWEAGLLLGALMCLSYALQTLGLQRTNASNAALITGMFIVFIPVLSILVLHKDPDSRTLAGVVVALVGLVVLTLQPHTRVGTGDAMLLGSTLFLSLYVIALDHYANRLDLFALTAVQMGVLAFTFLLSGLAMETAVLPAVGFVWFSVAVCGIFGSALAFWVQAYAQRETPPSRIAVIIILEPVFGVVFGIALLGERLGARGWVGASLILAGTLISEVRARSTR